MSLRSPPASSSSLHECCFETALATVVPPLPSLARRGCPDPPWHDMTGPGPNPSLLALPALLLAGKSSVLAALLGELQPTRHPSHGGPAADNSAGGGSGRGPSPVKVQGTVAYCSQVPWIVSGTVKVCHCLHSAGECGWRMGMGTGPACRWAGRLSAWVSKVRKWKPLLVLAGTCLCGIHLEARMLAFVPSCSAVPAVPAVQENILFGRRYDEARYNAVLKACALEGAHLLHGCS